MSLVFIFLIQVLFGWGVLNLVGYHKGLISKLSLSYLLGLFVSSFSIYVLELIHMRLSFPMVVGCMLLFTLIVNLSYRKFLESVLIQKRQFVVSINLFDIVNVCIIAYFLYFSVWRMYHLPVVPYDALVGIDLLAKYAVKEGHVVSSIFTNQAISSMLSTQPFYAPLTSFNQIVYRLAGTPYGQVWIPFAAIAFCGFTYVRLKEGIHSLFAGFVILLMFFATELYSYTYLLQTDYINAVLFSIAVVFLWDHVQLRDQEGNPKYLLLASIFFALSVWARIETIILVGFMSLWLIYEFLKTKEYILGLKQASWLLGISVVPNILWNIVFYNFILPLRPDTSSELNWGGKYSASFTSDILDRMNFYLFSKDYWGYILYVFIFCWLVNAIIHRDRASWYILFSLLVFYVAFFLMLHHFEKVNVQATYRRGVFKVLLMTVLFFGELKILRVLGGKIKDWIFGVKQI